MLMSLVLLYSKHGRISLSVLHALLDLESYIYIVMYQIFIDRGIKCLSVVMMIYIVWTF